jgi:hypothetical protein
MKDEGGASMLDWVSIRDPTARAAAKAAYCEKHPLPQPAVRRVIIGPKQGYYVSAGGHTHYYGGAAGRRVAAMVARADCEPIPDALVPFERDGQLMWLGQRGVYPVGTTPDLFKASLERALHCEKTANLSAADTKQPGKPLELQQ